jgi:hypothetical protein
VAEGRRKRTEERVELVHHGGKALRAVVAVYRVAPRGRSQFEPYWTQRMCFWASLRPESTRSSRLSRGPARGLVLVLRQPE